MQLKLPRCKIRRQPEWKNPRLPAPPCNITGIACPTQSCRLPIFFFPPLHFLKHIWNSLFLYPSSSSSSLLLFSLLFSSLLLQLPLPRFSSFWSDPPPGVGLRFVLNVFLVSFSSSLFSSRFTSLSLRELSCEFSWFLLVLPVLLRHDNFIALSYSYSFDSE